MWATTVRSLSRSPKPQIPRCIDQLLQPKHSVPDFPKLANAKLRFLNTPLGSDSFGLGQLL